MRTKVPVRKRINRFRPAMQAGNGSSQAEPVPAYEPPPGFTPVAPDYSFDVPGIMRGIGWSPRCLLVHLSHFFDRFDRELCKRVLPRLDDEGALCFQECLAVATSLTELNGKNWAGLEPTEELPEWLTLHGLAGRATYNDYDVLGLYCGFIWDHRDLLRKAFDADRNPLLGFAVNEAIMVAERVVAHGHKDGRAETEPLSPAMKACVRAKARALRWLAELPWSDGPEWLKSRVEGKLLRHQLDCPEN